MAGIDESVRKRSLKNLNPLKQTAVDKFIIPLILSIALLFPDSLAAQDCSCTNCSQAIPISSSTNFTFEVSGSTNDNLANASQGVCGVVIEFSHDFIWAVEMVLTSPSGQQIQLIGPTIIPPLGSYTGFAYWDIAFLPTAVAASPDPPFSIVWDNNQNWQTAGRYNGSYYPNMGNLEDFNIGTVNGTWTLTINNSSSFYAGFIDDFRVVFCDEDGLSCYTCQADAGDVSVSVDISECEGSSNLQFTPLHTYPGAAPDPSEFSFTYIISRSDTILEYQISPDLSTYPPGTYTICGLSYLSQDTPRLPNPTATPTPTISALELELIDPINPYICGDISNDCISVFISAGIREEINDTICEGTIYIFEGSMYSATGQYEARLVSASSCDSIRVLNLVVNDTIEENVSATICEGMSYTLDGVSYTTSGSYSAQFVGSNGCDSTVNLTLVVNDTIEENVSATICEGMSYTLDGVSYTTSGSYSAQFVGSNGCDSTVNLTLVVNDTIEENVSATICEGMSYTLDGVPYTTSGSYSAQFVGSNGCDSIVNLTLVVNDTIEENVSATICEGMNYTLDGVPYTASGSYSAQFISSNGCDSIVNLTLVVNDTIEENVSATICEGTSYTLDGVPYTASGSYSAQFVGSNGCDSTVNLTLVVNDTIEENVSATICEGMSYTLDGVSYTTNGSYSAQFISSNGCDSTVNLTLVVNDTIEENVSATICEGMSYTLDGVSYMTSGSYSAQFISSNGCDSTVNLTLVVNDTIEENVSATICEGMSYTLDGVPYTTSGSYSAQFISSNGCDSIINLTLIVNDTLEENISATICEGMSYTLDGVPYTMSGSYSAQLLSSNGCDSIVNLTLVVNDTIEENISATICEGMSYTLDGVPYTTSGSYSAQLLSSNGCDSIVNLTLVVNDTIEENISAAICEGTSYTLDGVSYTTSGSYSAQLLSSNGCDSIVNLTLVVNDTIEENISTTICEGMSYTLDGVPYSTSGSYSAQLLSSNGCDSIVNLTLIVNDTIEGNISATICEGMSYTLDGVPYTMSGSYSAQLLSSNGCDSIVNLTLVVNDTIEENISATICEGASYTLDGIPYTTSGSYNAQLLSSNGCDSIVNLTLVVNDTIEENISAAICEGTSYTLDGVSYTTSGSYSAQLLSNNGCDSIVNLTLIVNDTIEENISATICEGMSYTLDGVPYTTSGSYSAQLLSSNGCDSIVNLTLVVNDTIEENISATICEGTSYTLDGVPYTTSGSYSAQLLSSNGCDSIVNLTLVVNDTIEENISATICEGASYTLDGVPYTTSGSYSAQLLSSSGCDSIVNLTLVVNDTIEENISATICEGASYTLDGVPYTTSGNYSAQLLSSNGCDSIVNLTLVVNDTIEENISATICEGASYTLDGVPYSTSGSYSAQLLSSNGCDSIVNLTLIVNDTIEENISATICEGASYTLDGVPYSTSGSYSVQLLSSTGCDSIVNLTLVVNDTIEESISATICEGASYTLDGVPYTTSGSYSAQLLSSNGCDSIVNLTLIVNDTIEENISATICEGASYTLDGVPYTTSGSYSAQLLSSSGCDSIVNLTLVVNDTIEENISATICEGASYTLDGVPYTTSGSYSAQLLSSNGCDSIVNLTLVVNDTLEENISATICEGASYTLDGVPYSTSGSYSAQLLSSTGCDSIVNLTLVVNDTIEENISATICEGTSYTLDGVPYSTSGSYSAQLLSSNGCDSIVNLTLVVNDTIEESISATICEGASYILDGVPYTTSGSYSAQLLSSRGCDSIVNLTLVVNDTIEENISATICEGASYTLDGVPYSTSGSYSAQLLSSNGCDSIVNLTLVVNDTLEENISATICEGASYTLDGVPYTTSGSYSVQLLSSSGCDSIVNLDLIVSDTFINDLAVRICEGEGYEIDNIFVGNPGNYTFNLYTANGCDSIVNLELEVSMLETLLSVSGELSCAQNSVMLDGSGSTSGDDIIAEWLDSLGNSLGRGSVREVFDAGMYTFVLSDTLSNCIVYDSIEVLGNSDRPLALIDPLGPLQLDCGNNTTVLSGFGSGPLGDLVFEWYRNGNFFSADIEIETDSSGLFRLIVRDTLSGCRDTAELAITDDFDLPIAIIAEPSMLDCRDSMIVLDASASSMGVELMYLWERPSVSAIISGDSSLTPLVQEAGLYVLTVFNPLNGCNNKDTVVVIADQTPPLADAGVDIIIDCDQETSLLDGSNSSQGNNFSYLWSGPSILTGEQSLQATINKPGTYSLLVTSDGNGCTAIDQVMVTTEGPNGLGLTINEPSCFGWGDGSISVDTIFGGTAPYRLSLNNAPYQSVTGFQRLGEGTYTLTVADAIGCEWDTVFQINQPIAVQIDLGIDQGLALGDSFFLSPIINLASTAIDTFIWRPSELLTCPSCPNQWVQPFENTTYSLQVISEEGCVGEDEIQFVVDRRPPVYIPNAFTPNGDQSNDKLIVFAGTAVQIVRVFRIYDRFGDTLFEAKQFAPNDPAYGWDGTFNGQALNPAVFVYYAEVELLDGTLRTFKGDITLLR